MPAIAQFERERSENLKKMGWSGVFAFKRPNSRIPSSATRCRVVSKKSEALLIRDLPYEIEKLGIDGDFYPTPMVAFRCGDVLSDVL